LITDAGAGWEPTEVSSSDVTICSTSPIAAAASSTPSIFTGVSGSVCESDISLGGIVLAWGSAGASSFVMVKEEEEEEGTGLSRCSKAV